MKSLIIILSLLTSTLICAQPPTWERTNPGGGGAIAAVGATASGMIVVASDLSGIFRSTDNGLSWDAVGANQGLKETHISSFGFDPNDGDAFIAGTYRGAYKTTDGGDTFTFVFPDSSHPFSYSYIEDIAIANSNSNIGYITHHPSVDASGDVYKTADGGDSWDAVPGENLPNDLHLIKLMVHPTDANIVYVLAGKSRWGCSTATLYRSTNGGVHWTNIGAAQGDILDVDLHPTDPDIVYISTFTSLYVDNASCKNLSFGEYFSDDETQGELYKSTNGGTTFIEIGDKTGIISVGINDPDTIRVLDILFPYDWNSDAGTWETGNGGTTWTQTGTVDNWDAGFIENQYYAFALSFNGLNKTVTKDLFNSNRYYGSFGQWAWGSFDGGQTLNNISTKEIGVNQNKWLSTGVENINGHALDINDGNPDVVFIGGYDIGFWYTRDHGLSWTRTQPDFNIYPAYSWDLGTDPVPSNIAKRGAGSNVMTVLSDPDREHVVWASFSKEQSTDPIEGSEAKTGLFRSTNYGEDWTLLSSGLPAFAQPVRMYGISMDVNSAMNSRTLYITVDGDVYKSTNDGSTWSMVLNNGGVMFTEVDKYDGDIVYAGGKNGLWRSINAGASWTEVGTVAMRKLDTDTRPDIVPTWTDWTGGTPTYSYQGVFDIAVDPNMADRVYVTVIGPEGGLYKSDNKGDTWSTNLLPDSTLRGVAITPLNSNIIYATSARSYHSGGFGNSIGVQFSLDAGNSWQDANEDMAYDYAGMIEVESGTNPYVWTWSPGTGMQRSLVPKSRCTHVTSTIDDGIGSLRAAMACATDGDTITFDITLDGSTVSLTSEALTVDKNITFYIPSDRNIVVTTTSVMPALPNHIFTINQNKVVNMDGLNIKGGYGPDGTAILNNGNLTIKNTTLSDNGEATINSVILNNSGAQTVILENVEIVKD